MKIVFGWHLDGPTCPETPGGEAHAVDEAVVGPLGLLHLLEGQLGRSGPAAPAALRIAQFLARLRAIDDGDRFFSDSFTADAWATARLILSWRDALITARLVARIGWLGEPTAHRYSAGRIAGTANPRSRRSRPRARAHTAHLPPEPVSGTQPGRSSGTASPGLAAAARRRGSRRDAGWPPRSRGRPAGQRPWRRANACLPAADGAR